MKSFLAKKDISIHTKKSPVVPWSTHFGVWMRVLEFLNSYNRTRCSITVVSTETATNHMDYKGVKQKVLREADKITQIEHVNARQISLAMK